MKPIRILYREKVHFPIRGTKFYSLKEIIIFRIILFLVILFAIFLVFDIIFSYESKQDDILIVLFLIVLAIILIFIVLYINKQNLYGAIPIRMYSDSILMPSSFFEKYIFKRKKIPINKIKKIYTESSNFLGTDLYPNGFQRLHDQLTVITKDGKKYISGPKGLRQIKKMIKIIKKYWPENLNVLNDSKIKLDIHKSDKKFIWKYISNTNNSKSFSILTMYIIFCSFIMYIMAYFLLKKYFSFWIYNLLILLAVLILDIILIFLTYYFYFGYLGNSKTISISTLKYFSKPKLKDSVRNKIIKNIEQNLKQNKIRYKKYAEWEIKLFPTIFVIYLINKNVPIRIIQFKDSSEIKICVGNILPNNNKYFSTKLRYILENSFEDIMN